MRIRKRIGFLFIFMLMFGFLTINTLANQDGYTIIISSDDNTGVEILSNQNATNSNLEGIMSNNGEITTEESLKEFWKREVRKKINLTERDDVDFKGIKISYILNGQETEIARYDGYEQGGNCNCKVTPTKIDDSFNFFSSATGMYKQGEETKYKTLDIIRDKCEEIGRECQGAIFKVTYLTKEETNNQGNEIDETMETKAIRVIVDKDFFTNDGVSTCKPIINTGVNCENCPTEENNDAIYNSTISNFEDFYRIISKYTLESLYVGESPNPKSLGLVIDVDRNRAETHYLILKEYGDIPSKERLRAIFNEKVKNNAMDDIRIRLHGNCGIVDGNSVKKVEVYNCFGDLVLKEEVFEEGIINLPWGGTHKVMNTESIFAQNAGVCSSKTVIEKDKCDKQISKETVIVNYDNKLKNGTNTHVSKTLSKNVNITKNSPDTIEVKEDGVCPPPITTFDVKFISCDGREVVKSFNKTTNGNNDVVVESPWGKQYTVNQNETNIIVKDTDCQVTYKIETIACDGTKKVESITGRKGEVIVSRFFGKDYNINSNMTIKEENCNVSPTPSVPAQPPVPPKPFIGNEKNKENDEKYTVKFLDCRGKVVSEQVVKSGTYAVAPTKYRYNQNEFEVVWENKTIKPITCNYSVNTSEKSNIIIYISIGVVSLVGLISIIIIGKKNKEKD